MSQSEPNLANEDSPAPLSGEVLADRVYFLSMAGICAVILGLILFGDW